MDTEILSEIGLTKGEIAVYLSLLKLGEVTTGKIIADADISSGKIYEILDKLAKKGLVKYIIKDKTKYFSASNPNKIIEFMDRKEYEMAEKKKEFEKVLPQLESIYAPAPYSAVIHIGIEGFKTAIYETLETLEPNDEWLAFGISTERKDTINIVWDHFVAERKKRKISGRMIFNDIESMKRQCDKSIDKGKIMPTINNAAPVSISGNIVLIYNWKELSVIKIVNKDIAESFRGFFENLWKIVI